MKCQDLLAALNEYVDGTLDPGVCEQFEKHLEGCNPCQIVVDNIRKTITLYKGDEVFELPVGLKDRLHDVLRARWRELHGGHGHGRHGAKQPERFDPAKAARLDDPRRFEHLLPADVLALLDAPPGGLVIDFGTGTGTYALEVARARPDLRVVALDEQEPMLALLRSKLAAAPVPNVEPVLSGTGAAKTLVGKADRILALNVLHELGDDALRELSGLLKLGGRAVFIDWNADIESRPGPPRDHVYSPSDARVRLAKHGFTTVREQLLSFQYAIVSTV